MKNFLRENWFKIGLLVIIFFGLTVYLKHMDESNVLQSRIEYADCKGKLDAFDQKEVDNNTQFAMANFEDWRAACNQILSYK
jgi:hypothetical protein